MSSVRHCDYFSLIFGSLSDQSKFVPSWYVMACVACFLGVLDRLCTLLCVCHSFLLCLLCREEGGKRK